MWTAFSLLIMLNIWSGRQRSFRKYWEWWWQRWWRWWRYDDEYEDEGEYEDEDEEYEDYDNNECELKAKSNFFQNLQNSTQDEIGDCDDGRNMKLKITFIILTIAFLAN